MLQSFWRRWLKKQVGVRSACHSRAGSARKPRRRTSRPAFEQLECRLAPAVISFNNSAGGDWDTDSNWDLARVPLAGDDVRIDLPNVTVTRSTGNLTVSSLFVRGAGSTFIFSGDSLAVTGAVQVTNTATLTVDGGTLGVSFSGNLMVNGATVTLNDGALALPNNATFGIVTVPGSGGTLTINGGTLTAPGDFTFNSGTLTVNGGTLTAPVPSAFNVNNSTFNLNGGTIADQTTPRLINATLSFGPDVTGTPTFLVHGNSSLTGNVPAGATVWVQGHGSFGGNATLNVPDGASNAGTIRLQSTFQGWDSSLTAPSTGAFTNAAEGVIEANAGTGGNRFIRGNLTNQGLLRAGAGEFFTITAGVYEAAGGTNEGNSFVFNSQLRVTASPAGGTTIGIVGTSTLLGDNLAGTTLWVQGHGSFTPQNATLNVQAGASNAGTIRLQSTFQGWNSNLVVQDEGAFTNAAGGALQVNPGTGGNRTFVGQLTNHGTVSLTGGETLSVQGTSVVNQDSGVIEGSGVLNLNFSGGAAPLSNFGTVRVPAGALLRIQGPFQNFSSFDQRLTGGTYDVTGTLRFDGADVRILAAHLVLTSPGSQVQNPAGANALTNLATIRPDGGFPGSFTINGRNFDTAAAVTVFRNEGTLNVGQGSTFRSVRDYTQTADAALNIDRGRMRIEGTFTNFAAGTLTGGQYSITGPNAIDRGTLQFAGANIVTNAATIELDGAGSEIIDLTLPTPQDGLRSFATNAGGFVIRNGRSISTPGGLGNTGTLTIGPASTFTANGDFGQAGSVDVQAGGTLTVTGTFTQDGGSTVVNGGASLAAGTYTQNIGSTFLGAGAALTAAGGVNVLGGVLSGSGTLNADVLNASQIVVGGSGVAGILTINGSYTQTADGVLDIEIGGLVPDSEYDQLVVTGSAALAGTLNVFLIGGFVPNPGDAFRILSCGILVSPFDTINGLAISDTLAFNPSYDELGLTLTTLAL